MKRVSRAEYFRKRRETIGQFTASVPREKLDKLNAALKERGITKVQWLTERIDREIGEKTENSGSP